LRAHGSSFLRTELLLLLLAFPLCTAGCGPREVWGVPADTLASGLAAAKYSSLPSVDLSQDSPEEALGRSPDAPYYLSFIFDTLGRKDNALAMLELAWSRSPSPWREEAGVLLAQRYNALKSWDRAADVARRLLAAAPPPAVEQEARRALVEALYWTGADAAVLDESARITDPDAEVLLFRGVSSLRLGLPAGHDLVMQLFLDEKVSSLDGRLAAFLAADPALLARLAVPGYPARAERAVLIAVEAYDWNCPQHITPRYTLDEIEASTHTHGGEA
jgi:hypothetical protein